MITAIIVEDNPIMQKYLEDMLVFDGRFSVIGKYRDAFEAEAFIREKRPQLVLMDIQTLHNHSGLSAGKSLRKGKSLRRERSRPGPDRCLSMMRTAASSGTIT